MPSESPTTVSVPDAQTQASALAERLSTLLSTISAGIFETDALGRFVYANPATLKVIGYTAEQIIGRSPQELGIVRFDADGRRIEPDDAPLATAGRDRRGTVNAVIRFSGLPVADVWLESQTTPLYSATGHHLGNVVSFIDVTARFQLESERKAGQEQLHDVLRLMGVGVMLVDTNGRIEYANAAALGGRLPEDVVGQLAADPVWRLTDEAGRTLPYDALPVPTVLREQRAVHDVQLGVPMPDGSVRWIRANATPRFSVNGELRGAVVTVEDVTERRLLAEQLMQAQKIEGIGQLAGGVAHDFNNLLTTIIGNADIAFDSVAPHSELASIIDEIREAAARGATLTRQLLMFGKKQVVQPQVVQLDSLSTGIERLLHRLIGEDIMLHHVADPSVWPVMIDPGQMEQVIMNMAINARDAMPDGGTLTITLQNVTVGARETQAHTGVAPGDFVMLALNDTGAGMTDDTRSHLFEPFFTTKDSGRGSGLGLSICHGVVKQARGFIAVDSSVGRGTTFSIYLPRTFVAVEPQRPTNDAPRIDDVARSGTIILVEDEISVRALVARLLRAAGFFVLDAEGGVEALALVDRLASPPDMLVTDIVMPGLRGPDVARAMRQRFPELPVLFTTGYTDPSIVGDLPMDAKTNLLLKPFTNEQLVMRVQELLAAKTESGLP